MPEDASLVEAMLHQGQACHWLMTRDAVFDRVFGDSVPLFGKSRADLEKRAASAVLGSGAAVWTARLQRVFSGEELQLRELRGPRTFDVSLYPVRIGGEIRYASGMAREVTPWNTAEQELRHTVLGALRAMEFERNMVSRFLHDSIGQNLTALGLQLDLMRMDLESVAPSYSDRIGGIQKVLEDMMEQTREYTYELNPNAVERTGLRPALDRMVARLRERFPGAVRVNVDPSFRLDRKIASAMFQIAQEAAQNAVQHSGCSLIEIAIKSTRTGTLLEVKDNGRGFDAADLRPGGRGLGLLSMEHYAAEAGLELRLTSQPGTGTTVRVVAEEPAKD